MPKKPKYQFKQSPRYPDWWVVEQISNSVIIAHLPSQTLAELFVEFLNGLPGKRQPKLKKKPLYPNLKKKIISE